MLGSEPLSFLAALHGFSRAQTFEARLVLEVMVAGLAAERTKDQPERLIAISDETTALPAAAVGAVTFRMPYAFRLQAVRASLTTASSSGLVTVDINEGGVSVLSTKLTLDATEKTSVTAATPAVISDPDLANDAEITIDIDTGGTGAVGLKVYLIGHRV